MNRGQFKKGHIPANFKGKRYCLGYVLIYQPNHPFRSHNNCIRESRLVMEKKIRRYLKPEEVIHHINGIKDDNRIENLELFSTHKEHLAKCHKEFFRNPLNTFEKRQCTICRKVLELNDKNFHRTKLKLGFSYTCRKCNKKRMEKYHREHPRISPGISIFA
ncbi:MAG: HNH endonuclease [Patescibacteria group bacterium]